MRLNFNDRCRCELNSYKLITIIELQINFSSRAERCSKDFRNLWRGIRNLQNRSVLKHLLRRISVLVDLYDTQPLYCTFEAMLASSVGLYLLPHEATPPLKPAHFRTAVAMPDSSANTLSPRHESGPSSPSID